MKSKAVFITWIIPISVTISFLSSCTNQSSIVVKKDIMIPMADGIELASNIYLPHEKGEFPIVLVRTPFGKDIEEDDEEDDWGEYWVENGYGFVIQDCRGTGDSEGEWYPVLNEKADGLDTRKWILEQPWCNSRIGTSGGSYLGYTQFVSSMEPSQDLKAMFAYIPMIDTYRSSYYHGALRLGTIMGWGLEMANPSEGEGALIDEDFDMEKAYSSLPLIDFDLNVDTTLIWMHDWIENPTENAYWKRYHPIKVKENINVPVVTVSGWYDIFLQQALDYQSKATDMGKKNQHLIVGPWIHGPNEIAGERLFADNHELDFEKLEKNWFDIWLKGVKNDINLAPFKLYVMGKNEWRDENEWPLQRTEYTNYYFESEGKANALTGNGTLSVKLAGKEAIDHFIYDPHDPVPTHGGAILFEEAGVYDQREIEARDDVLVYSSQVLKKELEVTGPLKVILYAGTDSRDTDWTAKLLDVYPDGRAFNLCDGIVRARYHKNPLKPELITANRIYKYEIDLWSTSNVFLKGHKIRVEISSSNFPRFDRNPNTGNEFGMDDEIRIAKQTIYHNEKYPSHIILPVIPNSE